MITGKLEFDPDVTLIQHACLRCGHKFVDEIRSGNLYAVHLNAPDFDMLSVPITTRRPSGGVKDRDRRFLGAFESPF
jgi:hypothetical protein